MSNTMTFRLGHDGNLSLVDSGVLENVKKDTLKKYDEDRYMKSMFSKLSEKSKIISYSVAPLPILLTATGGVGSVGIFWDTFMNYIFPYMMDIAKVFCAIKIAQAFYQERRGGRDEGTGVGAFVTYGKWYILFALMPWCVELLDELGTKMLLDLRSNGLQ